MGIVITTKGAQRIDGEIPIFTLNRQQATLVYNRMCALAERYANVIAAFYATKAGNLPRNPERPFSTISWSPEADERAALFGRKSPESIEVHSWYQAPAFIEALQAEGLDTHVYVQKYDLWVMDRYNRLSDLIEPAASRRA